MENTFSQGRTSRVVVLLLFLGLGLFFILYSQVSADSNSHTKVDKVSVSQLDSQGLYELMSREKSSFNEKEKQIIQERIDKLDFGELYEVIAIKINEENKVIRSSRKSEYKKSLNDANLEAYRRVVNVLGEDTKVRDISESQFTQTFKGVVKNDSALENIISFTGSKLGENTIVGSFDKPSLIADALQIDSVQAGGGFCDFDDRWPHKAVAQWKIGSFHVATGIDRVKNEPNEFPCDYRVHFHAHHWVTSDGWDWFDFQMVNHHGGVEYSHSGDRVIVGYGSAARWGNLNEWSVKHGTIMRTW